jgi:hypothetical protein
MRYRSGLDAIAGQSRAAVQHLVVGGATLVQEPLSLSSVYTV